MLHGKKKFMITIMLLLGSFILGITSAKAYSIWYSKGFSSSSPININVDEKLSRQMVEAVDYASETWSKAGKDMKLKVVRKEVPTKAASYPKRNGLNEITQNKMGSNKYLMQCTVYGLNGQVIEADININTSYPWGNAKNSSKVYDYNGVMTHEMGHMLGLGHSEVKDSTMYETAYKGEIKKRELKSDDIRALKAIYKK